MAFSDLAYSEANVLVLQWQLAYDATIEQLAVVGIDNVQEDAPILYISRYSFQPFRCFCSPKAVDRCANHAGPTRLVRLPLTIL